MFVRASCYIHLLAEKCTLSNSAENVNGKKEWKIARNFYFRYYFGAEYVEVKYEFHLKMLKWWVNGIKEISGAKKLVFVEFLIFKLYE